MSRAVDLRQLRYFVAVAEELNFRRAAERLHITQPPLSRQISQLEAALGTTLLERDTKHVRLTPAGQVALQEFRPLLAACDASLERVARTRKAPKRRLRLGMAYWSDLAGLADFEQALQATGLVTGADVLSLASHESMAAVKRGDLDAALMAGPVNTHGLPHVVIGRERHVAFVPQSHPLARKKSIALNDLRQLPAFFRFRRAENPVLYDHFARQYEAAGFRHPEEVPGLGAMGLLAQIAAGRGGTIMPRAVAARPYPGVAAVDLRDEITIDLLFVVGPHVDLALRETLLALAPRLAPAVAAAPAPVASRPPASASPRKRTSARPRLHPRG
jgi:DNA-binding transcriptional LysR family regulator